MKSCQNDSDDEFFDCTENEEMTNESNGNTNLNMSVPNQLAEKLQDQITGNVDSLDDAILTSDGKSDSNSHMQTENCTLPDEPEKTKKDLTAEEKEVLRLEAMRLKEEGNENFKLQGYAEADKLYSEGLRICPHCFTKERSILFSNRSACRIGLNRKQEAILDCTEAIQLNPQYVKALLRRAKLYEEEEKFDEALDDYKIALNVDPTITHAKQACARLPQQIDQRNEKLKAEMLGTLKDLGNKVLGKFGLSTNDFQLQQNPDTGGYNIQFKQKSPGE